MRTCVRVRERVLKYLLSVVRFVAHSYCQWCFSRESSRVAHVSLQRTLAGEVGSYVCVCARTRAGDKTNTAAVRPTVARRHQTSAPLPVLCVYICDVPRHRQPVAAAAASAATAAAAAQQNSCRSALAEEAAGAFLSRQTQRFMRSHSAPAKRLAVLVIWTKCQNTSVCLSSLL